MRKMTGLFLISVILFMLEAEEPKCWRYDASRLIAWNSWVEPGKKHLPQDEVKPIEWVYIMALGEVAEKKDIALVAKTGERIYRHNYISCYKKEYGFACGGECDSGQLQLDKQMRLHLEQLDFVKEVKYEGPVAELVLKSRDEKAWLKANAVACPEHVFEGPYVCYDERKGKEYQGCVRSPKQCKRIGKKHFGRYPDEQATRDALWRCQNSESRFVD